MIIPEDQEQEQNQNQNDPPFKSIYRPSNHEQLQQLTQRLSILRREFSEADISYRPVPTKQQTSDVRTRAVSPVNCRLCGTWHHPRAAHLSYVGHAAVTNRLLEADPFFSWHFLALDENGLPRYDKDGGLWINLTVCGVTRQGYGDATNATGTTGVKEIIGDAIRNAAMRFGVALELWHKGEFEKPSSACDADEFYSDDKFNANINAWREQIIRGDKTAEEVVHFLTKIKKVNFSPEQIDRILACGKQQPTTSSGEKS